MMMKTLLASMPLIATSACYSAVTKVVNVSSSFSGLETPSVEITLNNYSLGTMRYVKSLHQFESIEFDIETKVDVSASSINVTLSSSTMECRSSKSGDIPMDYATDWDLDFNNQQLLLGVPLGVTFSGSIDGGSHYIDHHAIQVNLYKSFSSFEDLGARCDGNAVILFESLI